MIKLQTPPPPPPTKLYSNQLYFKKPKTLNTHNTHNIMVNITMSIPEELKKEMEQFPEINWSAIAREAIKQRLILFKELKEFTKDSTLTIISYHHFFSLNHILSFPIIIYIITIFHAQWARF